MKQVVQRWIGIGLVAATVLTVGGMLMLKPGMPLAQVARVHLTGTPTAIRVEPNALMADGGGDAPIICKIIGHCRGGEATL
jgi:hypothetical protein